MIKIFAIAVLASTFLCLPSVAATNEPAQPKVNADEDAIRAIALGVIERFNKHEASPPSSYTQDADFVNVYGVWMRGATEIQRGRKSENAVVLKDAKITLLDLNIRFIRSDVAIVHQTHDLSGKRTSSGDPLPVERQINTRILVKERGKWLTTSFQNTIVRPAQAPTK